MEMVKQHILGRLNVVADHFSSINRLVQTAANFTGITKNSDMMAMDLRAFVEEYVSDTTTSFLPPITWEMVETHLRKKGWEL